MDMGFTTEQFPAGTHMCLIYSSEEERKNVISKFIGAGISNGEKVGYFADDMSPEDFLKWLAEAGIDIPSKDMCDNFKVTTTLETYCPDGKFEPDQMLNTLKKYYISAINENYSSCRVSGEMAWALRGIPGSERLMEYESKINTIVVQYPVTAICQYDANKFDGFTIFECLKVHPYMIVKGQIVRNPYYLRPEEYLN
jgi:hypothetical protein